MNWKALGIGVLMLLIVSTGVSWLVALYLPDLYGSMVSSGRPSGLQIVLLAVASVIPFGVSAYVAAFIAGRAYVLHGLAVGLAGSAVLLALNLQNGEQHLMITTAIYALSVLIAACAGRLRQYQVGSA